jgi:hypothetical protein
MALDESRESRLRGTAYIAFEELFVRHFVICMSPLGVNSDTHFTYE